MLKSEPFRETESTKASDINIPEPSERVVDKGESEETPEVEEKGFEPNIDPQIVTIARDMTKLRHDFHQHPEIAYEEDYAHDRIRELLDEWELEYEVMTETGIVVTLEGYQNTSKKVVGLRADMDALCVSEEADVPWKSRNDGKMHACGHDGHMATMLTALAYLKDNREFNGTLKIIFQPAEEGSNGAETMIGDGLIKKHKIGMMYAFHNWPYIPLGKAAIHTGPVMASCVNFEVTLKGRGCHGALPEEGRNPIPIAFELGSEFGAIRDKSAQANPDEKLVLSICSIEAGSSAAMNIIPGTSVMTGTMRTYNLDIKESLVEQIREKTKEIEEKYGITATIEFPHSTAPTINNRDKAQISREAMTKILGEDNTEWDAKPAMTAEDFGEFSSLVPSSYIWIGNAEPDDPASPHSQPLHNPGYGFNDKVIPIGAQYFVNVVKAEMPLSEGWTPPTAAEFVCGPVCSFCARLRKLWNWLKAKLMFWKKK